MPNGRYAIGDSVIATSLSKSMRGKCRLGGRVTPPRRCVHVTTAYNKHQRKIRDARTEQSSAAALLGWSQTRLAKAAGASVYQRLMHKKSVRS